jgi:hypothetical protein
VPQIRIAFRLAEFGPGVSESNFLLRSEYYTLFLDALPMVSSLLLLNVVHPGMVLRGPDGEFPRLSRAQKKEVKQQKKYEKQQARSAKKGGYDNIVEVEVEVEVEMSPQRQWRYGQDSV